jgi:hypothetical protein
LTGASGGRTERIREMMQGKITDGDVTELVRSTADAASAYIRGDIQRYLTLIKHGDNYTLMAPYGGEPRRGFDVKEALETTPRMFRGGEADLELVRHMRRETWRYLWLSNGSTTRSAECRTRTGRCV